MSVTDIEAGSRREAAKADRRRRIVEAAAALLRDQGFEGVSMTQVAERAGVSPATLYNLFQTKAVILRQVFDQDLADYERMVAAAPARDVLERMFISIDIAAGLYESNPSFYRAMASGGAEVAPSLSAAIAEPRQAFWHAMIGQAMAEGRLKAGTDARVLGTAISQLMRGAYGEWVAGVVSARRMAQEAAYGAALMLQARADGLDAIRLRDKAAALGEALAAAPRGEPA